MPTISFLMLPEPGHLAPTFRIASLLQARGHRVNYLTVSDFEKPIRQQGFGFAPLLPGLLDNGIGVGALFETRSAGKQFYDWIGRERTRRRVSIQLELVKSVKACDQDALIIDSALFLKDSSLRRMACPVVRLSTAFTEPYGDQPKNSRFRHVPEMILCPEELDLPGRPPAAHPMVYVEPSVCRTRPEIEFPWRWIDPAKKLIYCSFGTQSRVYPEAPNALRRVMESFRGLDGFQLVMGIGGHQEPQQFGDVPANVLMVKSVPQLSLLSRAAVFITHGGLGGIKEAISSRVPMIVLPFVHDQPFNAERIVYHRLGASLAPSTFTPAELRRAIADVAGDESIRSAVRRFQQIFEQIEGESPSVDFVERHIRRDL
jgi:UDP:flavonoid glycosyltransferase YjiC (YdhE family)